MREQRLFYDDPYLLEFSSPLLGKEQRDAEWHVSLEQTAFYPTSGGQPHDTGTLNGIPVVNVYEDGETIWHILEADPGTGVMHGNINRQRRFDFMQQHGGQHILSQAFWQRLQATTIGFHLTETTLTIDLDVEHLSDEDILWVEQEANRIVWSNRRILAHWCDDQQLAELPLRKSPKVDKDIRVVEVEGYDWSPCGGTHPHFTAEIGLIKIRRWERAKGVTRVEFYCGWRALEDYRFKNHFSLQMAADLSVKDRELPAAWNRQLSNLRETELLLRQAKAELLESKARDLHAQAEIKSPYVLVCQKTSAHDFAELKQLSLTLATMRHTVALLAMAEGSTQIAFARSADLEQINLNQLVKPLLAEFGGKGGGTPQAVQGIIASQDSMDDFLRRVFEALHSSE